MPPTRNRSTPAPYCVPVVLAWLLAACTVTTPHLAAQTRPVLSFPERGLDEPSAYQGYQTRFFRDGARNTLQVYIDERASRVVHLWANAENESVGFTARSGKATVALRWADNVASVSGSAVSRRRAFEYRLIAVAPVVDIGWFLLGTMRVERDFQYERRQLAPFDSAPFRLPEYGRLVSALGRLEPALRQPHLRLLNAPTLGVLEARRHPTVTVLQRQGEWLARVTQPSLDGRDTMTLEFRADSRRVVGSQAGDSLTLRARAGGEVPFTVRITTTGTPLTPLTREEIFTTAFLRFLSRTRASATDSGSEAGLRARRLERQVRGVELLSSREKLMAGLPTYATYFGRDMLVSALMMRPIWRSTMSEAAIAAALRKLSPDGQVSHEEALGGQAVRESAAEYATLIDARFDAVSRGDRATGDRLLRQAAAVLRTARQVRENYHMVDDELQLPVLVARWITDPTVSASRKRAFLQADGGGSHRGTSRLVLVLRELATVARMTAPYSARPEPANLISFAPRDVTGSSAGNPIAWSSSSWRDSGVGYAGGRWAMDVNAIWAPQALESVERILITLRSLRLPVNALLSSDAVLTTNDTFRTWVSNPEALRSAITTWSDAARHFLVTRTPDAVREATMARIAAMPAEERQYWNGHLARTGANRDSLEFLAVALDASGAPIAVANTDPATRLFLGEREGEPMSTAPRDRARTLRDVRLFTRAYPAGLLVPDIGPAVANDAYAPPAVWDAFVKDPYHGPRVIWGREVNLFLLGVAERVRAAPRPPGVSPAGRASGVGAPDAALDAYRRELLDAIATVRRAVDASGFHSELWSYGFRNGRVVPERYGSGADLQLWSTTNLAVEFALSRLQSPPPPK